MGDTARYRPFYCDYIMVCETICLHNISIFPLFFFQYFIYPVSIFSGGKANNRPPEHRPGWVLSGRKEFLPSWFARTIHTQQSKKFALIYFKDDTVNSNNIPILFYGAHCFDCLYIQSSISFYRYHNSR